MPAVLHVETVINGSGRRFPHGDFAYYEPARNPCRHRTRIMQSAEFEELKKILILSAIFFMAAVVLIMSKLQIATEDLIRWSPLVWLLGVLLAGISCNGCFALRRLWRRCRLQREHQQPPLLYTLPLPSSYPCLAPPPHVGCCRAVTSASVAAPPLLGASEAARALARRLGAPSYTSLSSEPPSYDEATKSKSAPGGNLSLPPEYDDSADERSAEHNER